MDPTHEIVDSLILPYAAFHKKTPKPSNGTKASVIGPKNSWISIKTLSRSASVPEVWDIDGGETDRGFFCTVPKFARHKPPLRITTHMAWDKTHYSLQLSEVLELDAFFRAGKRKIHSLPLTQHLRKALGYWSSQRPHFQSEYESLPFGSKIFVDSLHEDVTQMRFRLVPDTSIEESWLSIDEFADEVSIPITSLSGMTVPWESLELVSHAHENISIVRITGQTDGPSFVFKALMEDTHYMYHELRLLLSMESHPNIIIKPHALVMKRRPGNSPGIAGFLLELYPGPTLQQRLHIEEYPVVTMEQKVSWSQQLVSALSHIRTQPPGYFPDFKPNNVVFTGGDSNDVSSIKPVLLDFEQRGTWHMWAPPEVRYVEYLELLALTSSEESVRERYRSLLREVFPHWTTSYNNRPLRDARDGYNLAWASLDTQARAKAQVYALGKVLWCIFENVPSPDGPHNVESFLEDFDQDQQFPEFRLSPPSVQNLVRRCTAGAPEWGDRRPGVARDGGRIVPWGRQGCEVTAEETQEAATRWWREELALAEDFVRHRYGRDEYGTSDHVAQLEQEIQERPSLDEVMEILKSLPTK
ncbi:hypothetical protein N0V93_006022 [Gnomoniopsis smithogilvyi]|uniref:Protein kinase domain-containing protein n=1 Tax=Gnomoniopsis smithogilvyi TaxID=1191159 RepID=A0A9W9CUC3_9PEZI|nr:hypothetical protein N0V93_006022 [Gnomoniopsis smithogilvyi]